MQSSIEFLEINGHCGMTATAVDCRQVIVGSSPIMSTKDFSVPLAGAASDDAQFSRSSQHVEASLKTQRNMRVDAEN